MKEIKEILVPIDLSERPDPTVTYALRLSKKLNARLHLLHAVREPAETSGFSTPHVSIDKVHEETRSCMERKLRLYPASQFGGLGDFVTEVRIGPPHAIIIRYAEEKEIDLIVIGERRKGKIAHALSRKTTSKVLEDSNRPVLRLILSG